MKKDFFCFSAEVKNALAEKKPVVALESTILSFGLPSPENYHLASDLENRLRKMGVTPATIAVIEGKIKIGLEEEDLLYLTDEKNLAASLIRKVGTRDLPFLLAKKASGATTVSATAFLAAKAGIHFFATGGIGGVHRGVETSYDISADLFELSSTSICVVSSGIKSILDVAKTLEVLETQRVSVATYGDLSSNIPMFYSASSQYVSPWKIKNVQEAADVYKNHTNLKMPGAFLLFNPIDKKDEIEFKFLEEWTQTILEEAKSKGIIGTAVTPFVLKRLHQVSEGKTLKANTDLIKGNVDLIGEISRVFFAS